MRSASIGLPCETRIIKYAVLLYTARRKGFVDLVFEKAGRRRCRHELTVHLGRNSTILDQLAVAELDLQKLRLGVLTGSAATRARAVGVSSRVAFAAPLGQAIRILA